MTKRQGWERGLGKYSAPTKINEGKVHERFKDTSRRVYADNEPGSHEIGRHAVAKARKASR